MDTQWHAIESANVHANSRVRLPTDIRDSVLIENAYDGEVVHWNHDTQENVALISNSELNNSRYNSVGISNYHDYQNTVTPPKKLIDKIAEDVHWIDSDQVLKKGAKMIYLANSKMATTEPVSYYLMSGKRFFRGINQIPNESDSLGLSLRSANPK